MKVAEVFVQQFFLLRAYCAFSEGIVKGKINISEVAYVILLLLFV